MYIPDSEDELAPRFTLVCKKQPLSMATEDVDFEVDYSYQSDLGIDELRDLLVEHMQELNDDEVVRFSKKQLANPFDQFEICDPKDFGHLDPFALFPSWQSDSTLKPEKLLEKLLDVCNFLEKYGKLGSRILADVTSDLDDAANMLNNYFEGKHESFKDFAQQYAESCNDIPDWLQNHIDWQSFADELEMDYTTIECGRSEVLVFRNN